MTPYSKGKLGGLASCVGEKLLNRKFAAVAIAASVLIGTTGCSFFSPIATMKVYTPGDGTDATVGPVEARNIIILAAPSGQTALFGSFINTSSSTETINIQIAGQTYVQNIEAGKKVDLGFNGGNAILLAGLTAKAGSLVDVTFTHGHHIVAKTLPVLDGTFAQYAPLVNSLGVLAPTPTPTP
jgi:hypothetical protein